MLLPGLFALTSLPAFPLPFFVWQRGGDKPQRSSVPDSHVSWVLVGLINGRHWQEIGGGRKVEAKVSVSPSVYGEMDSESCTVAALLPWLRSSSHCTDPLRSTLSWVTPPAPSPPSSLQIRISNSLLVSGLLH